MTSRITLQDISKEIRNNSSPFMYATITAIIIGVADIIAVVADIGWLIGDMLIQVHNHHWYVMGGLLLALGAMFLSFIWLFWSIYHFTVKRLRAKQEHYRRTHTRILAPTHCDIKKQVNRKPYQYIETTD